MFRLFRSVFTQPRPSKGGLDASPFGEDPLTPLKKLLLDGEVDNPFQSKTGVDFEEVPLSPFIEADPDMQALNPLLKMRPTTKDPKDLTIFETMLLNAGHDVEEDRFRDAIIEAQKEYAKYLSESRVFVSYKDQIPGYRRVVLLGPKICRQTSNRVGVIAVDDEGRLTKGIIAPEDRKSGPLQSVAEVIEVLRVGKEGWKLEADQFFDFDFNRHSIDFRQTAVAGLSLIVSNFSFVRGHVASKIKHTLKAKSERSLGLAQWALCDALDPEVLRKMRGTGLTKASHAHWLTGGDGVPLEIADARLQAVQSYPILARQLFSDEELRKTIDQRQPLAPAIARHFSTEEHLVKRLQGLTWQRAATTPRDTDDRVRDVLSFPEHAVPKTRQEYRDLEVIQKYGNAIYRKSLPEMLEHLGAGGSPWRFMDRMKETSAESVNDSIWFLVQKLFVPAMLNKIRSEAESRGMVWDHEKTPVRELRKLAAEKILSSFKFKELLDFSDRYHRNLMRYEDRLEQFSLSERWKPLLGEATLSDGVTVRELTSQKALKVQGRAENHCVGGYTNSILDGLDAFDGWGARVIYSIEKNGCVLSTAEFMVRMGKPDPESQADDAPTVTANVRQNYGYSNSDPEQIAVQAARELAEVLGGLSNDVFDDYLTDLEIAKMRAKMNTKVNDYLKFCGFNPWGNEQMEKAWEELSSSLPRSMRKKGLEAFIDQSPVAGMSLGIVLGEEPVNVWDTMSIPSENKLEEMELETPNYVDNDFENMPF